MNAAERAILRELVKVKAIVKAYEDDMRLSFYSDDQIRLLRDNIAALKSEVAELHNALKILKEVTK